MYTKAENSKGPQNDFLAKKYLSTPSGNAANYISGSGPAKPVRPGSGKIWSPVDHCCAKFQNHGCKAEHKPMKYKSVNVGLEIWEKLMRKQKRLASATALKQQMVYHCVEANNLLNNLSSQREETENYTSYQRPRSCDRYNRLKYRVTIFPTKSTGVAMTTI
uniref:Uncharacterized protein n=1 Tax=Romanomermis culicivorax TaxID=13658 RepID=A0A915L4Q9_ROMCU